MGHLIQLRVCSVDFDAGAEEFGALGNIGPYKLSDVGLTIGFGALNTLSVGMQNFNNKGIKIYPIPCHNDLAISSNTGVIGDIKIFNIYGQQILNRKIEFDTAKIDISYFSNGVYILKTDKGASRFVVE